MGGRLLTALFALALGTSGFAFSVVALREGSEPPAGGALSSPSPGASVGDGEIYYRVDTNDGTGWVAAVGPDGTRPHTVFSATSLAHHEELAFSPDGTRIAYVDRVAEERGIYVASADGANPIRLTDGPNDSWPAWSADSSQIAFTTTRDDPTIDFCHPGIYANCPTQIFVMGSDGSDVHPLTTGSGTAFDPTWSPSGAQIAFAATSDVSTPTAIFVMNADGSHVTRISSSHGGSDLFPGWSPDGSEILFGGIHWEDWSLFATGPDGGNERTILSGQDVFVMSPVWSPDGGMIAFGGSVGSQGNGVYVVDPDGTGARRLADVPDDAAVSELAWRPAAADVPSTDLFDVGLRGQTSGLAYGFGSMWVDGHAGSVGPGWVIRIDPSTGERIADISIGPVAPGFMVGGGGLAFGAGSVWVMGTADQRESGVTTGVGAVLVRIDPATNEVIDTIDLRGKVAFDVVGGDAAIWVLFSGADDKMVVDRIDPLTDRVVATIPLQDAYGRSIFAVGGSIIAFTNETTDVIGNSVLNVIDPATNSVDRRVPLGAYLWLAVSVDSVWASTGATLEKIDPRVGGVIDTWPIDSTGDALAVSDGVWFLSPRGRSSISRWNPAKQSVDLSISLPTGTTPNVLAVAPDGLWILNFEGTLTRIRLD